MDPFGQLTTERITSDTPVLQLPMTEAQFVQLANQVISESNTKLSDKKIAERQNTNRKFWRGSQVDSSRLDTSYQTPHVDNVVYQNEENRITLASSRLPEISLAPSDEEPETIERTQRAERAVRNRIDSSTIKRLIKDGLRHHDLDLIAAIKIRWDKNRGKNGDYVFELVDPRQMMFSSTGRIVHDGFTVDNIDVIIQWLDEPTQLVMSKFPNKKDELQQMWGMGQVPSRMRYAEVHFRWYDQQGKLMEGVGWKFGNVCLGMSKTPYFDYAGVPFVNSESGQIELKKRNFFDNPRKPYILFSYQNLGEWVYDDTTPFEQAIKLNAIINRRERQITEIADRTIPKIFFSSKAFKSGEAEKYIAKMNNPKAHIQLNGAGGQDVKKAIMIVQGNPPDMVLYNDAAALRGRVDSLFNTHGTTRGEIQGANQSGISKQITREGDLTISDDIVDFVVERVVFEMVSWALQMTRMYFTVPRKIRSKQDGKIEYGEVSTEDIDEDILPIVKASSTDAAIRRTNSQLFVSAKVTDPYTLYQDLEVDNPRERTKRWVAFSRGSQDMWRGYLEQLGIEDDMFDTGAQARRDIDKLIKGDSVTPPPQLDETYVKAFVDYKQSGQIANIPPDAQQRIEEYIGKLRQVIDGQINNAGQQPPGPGAPGAAPAPAGAQGQPAAPVS